MNKKQINYHSTTQRWNYKKKKNSAFTIYRIVWDSQSSSQPNNN